MKTKVNEVPLVGPKGRKELLRRINELEAQVAQQDYLRIQLERNPLNLTAEEKAKIVDAHKNGTIYDVVLVNADGDTAIIIADQIETDDLIAVFASGKVEMIDLT